jgi:Protein of unknwon function (DUF3310)
MSNNYCFGTYTDTIDSITLRGCGMCRISHQCFERTDKNKRTVKFENELKENEVDKANDIQVGGKHYKEMSVQPWDVIDSFTHEQRIGFYRGNAIKYIMRMGTKDECLNEIKKARHYLDKLIEVLDIEVK